MSKRMLPNHRIQVCLARIRHGAETVDVIINPEKTDARFKNLMTCGAIWVCPVCADRVTEQRAGDMLRAVAKWHAEGGFVALLTYTMQHGRNEQLVTTLAALRAAHRHFKAGRNFQTIKAKYNWVGSVTALEVTHGVNGWHPHLHELAFFEPIASTTWKGKNGRIETGFAVDVKTRWLAALAAHGRDASYTHGLDVRDADTDVYEYVTKFGRLPGESRWTLEREVVKAPSKLGRGKDGRTPFELLGDYAEGDLAAAFLFREYAAAFEGKQQLGWSRGLRALLGMEDELSDDEVAAALPPEYDVLVSIPADGWRALMRLPRDVRGELLTAAVEGGRAALLEVLIYLGVDVAETY